MIINNVRRSIKCLLINNTIDCTVFLALKCLTTSSRSISSHRSLIVLSLCDRPTVTHAILCDTTLRVNRKSEFRSMFDITYHPRKGGARASWRGEVRSPTWGAEDYCSHRRNGDSALSYRACRCGATEDRNLRCRSWAYWCGADPEPRHRETGETCKDIAGGHDPGLAVDHNDVTWLERWQNFLYG